MRIRDDLDNPLRLYYCILISFSEIFENTIQRIWHIFEIVWLVCSFLQIVRTKVLVK